MADEKTEPATDHKREEERKRGNIMKSQEVVIAAFLYAVALTLNFAAANIYRLTYGFFVQSYQGIPLADFSWGYYLGLLLKAAIILLLGSLPLAGVAFLVAWLATILQVGVLFSSEAMKLENGLKKLNPVNGFKNLFSLKKLVEVVKSFIKMIIIGWTIYAVVNGSLGPVLQSYDMGVADALRLAGHLAVLVADKVALAMIVIAAIDYLYQKWQYEKNIRMSKQEVKDEYKKLEGDPHVKGRQRQRQMEIAMGQARKAVPNADVVVTNPTHYAVALEYKPRSGMKAPVVIAKGKNHMARIIREIAEEHFILIAEDPPTARALYQVKIDDPIPPDLFQAVAKIIALLYKGRRPVAGPPPITSIPSSAPPLFMESSVPESPGSAATGSHPPAGSGGGDGPDPAGPADRP